MPCRANECVVLVSSGADKKVKRERGVFRLHIFRLFVVFSCVPKSSIIL
jgi:hypothetical protein